MTSDTELIRVESSCGQTTLYNGSDHQNSDLNQFEELRLYACIDICSGSSGCNKSRHIAPNISLLFIILTYSTCFY